MIIGPVLIDGTPVPAETAAIPVTDIALQRGYGCFETIRSYGGLPFRLDRHLDRLAQSALATSIPLPPRADLERWARDRAAEGDVSVRILVTGGDDVLHPGTNSRVVVMAERLPAALSSIRLYPVEAPWHPEGEASELTWAKTLSYGPNVAATLAARRAGFDDALLIGRTGQVLEGPSFSVGWVAGGVLETPRVALGILASITRIAVLEVAGEVGVPVAEGVFPLERMLEADEAFAMSTTKEVLPALAVGHRVFDVGGVTQKLAAGFRDLVAAELR